MVQINFSAQTATGLTNAKEMKKLVKSFNEMMKEQVREDFVSKVISIKEETAIYDERKRHRSIFTESLNEHLNDTQYRTRWMNLALKEHTGISYSDAATFYDENKKLFITERKMQNYVKKLADEHGVKLSLSKYKPVISIENPYYDEDYAKLVRLANDLAFEIFRRWEKYADDEHVKLDWLLFKESDKNLILTDKEFAEMLYEKVCAKSEYFSECRAYNDCFYIWLNKDITSIRKEEQEKKWRSIILSCLTYGRESHIVDDEGHLVYKPMVKDRNGICHYDWYIKYMGEERALEVYWEMKEKYKNAKRVFAGEDSDGCRYYSLVLENE